MELIFNDPYYDSAEEWEEGKYAKELAVELSEFDETIIAVDTSIGLGADWPVVLVKIFNNVDWASFLTIAGPSGLFLLGDKINKNIDAWLEIGKKLKKLAKKLQPTRIDENAATLMALNDILENTGKKIDFSVSLEIIEFKLVPPGKSKLDKRPDALYLITVRIPGKVFVYGIKSNGNIEFKHEFSTKWYEF